METCGGDAGIIDVDKTTETLEPEKMSSGGLCLPGKDRVEFRPPERKSLLGLDVLAIAKRAESVADGGFKAPRERVASVLASLEEEENFESSGLDEVGTDGDNRRSNHASRKYRESNASKTGSIVTQEDQVNDTPRSHHLSESMSSDALNTPIRSHQNFQSRSPMYDRDNRDIERKDYGDNSRSERRRVSHRQSVDRENYHRREARGRHDQDYDGEYGRKRSRYEGSRRTPGRSDWDDGSWEWEDTPRRDSHSHSSRRHQPSPSPMLVGASPDARLVSPWLGGQTPLSAGSANSPWDHVSPSPVPIRASGSSMRSSNSRHGGRSHQLNFSMENSETFEDGRADKSDASEENKYEITESMRLQMEYNSDRAWYDREEGNTMFDADTSSFFLGDEASFQKKEAELAKKLVRRDGTKMTLAQSKRMSQLTADNAQWEDRQLLRSGAVRGTEVQTEFDDEEERKVILLVHDTKPPFLDGRVVFTKQANHATKRPNIRFGYNFRQRIWFG